MKLDNSTVNAFKLHLRTYRSHTKEKVGERKEKGTLRKGDREATMNKACYTHV